MKLTTFTKTMFFIFLMSFIACKKNIDYVTHEKTDFPFQIKNENGRLQFNSRADLANLIQDLTKLEAKDIRNYMISNNYYKNDFISLYSLSELKQGKKIYNEPDRATLINVTNSRKNLNALMSGGYQEEPSEPEVPVEPEEPVEPEPTPGMGDASDIEALVPDPAFASILSPNNDMIVADTLYTVTAYGTFISSPQSSLEIQNIIDSLEINDVLLSEESRQLPGEVLLTEDLYQFRPGILRFDTYKNANTVSAQQQNTTSNTNSTEPGYPFLSQSEYDKLELYDFSAQTWAGKVLESLFGRTKAHDVKFDNSHRVKVNFYSVNFYVYSSVGINVKMQDKGGLFNAFWGDCNAQEIRMGWDGIEFENKFATQIAEPNITNINFGQLNLIDLPLNVKYLDFSMFNQQVPVGQWLNKSLNNTLDKTYQKALKDIWNELYQSAAPQQWKANDSYVKAFRAVYPDKMKTIVGRWETTAYNTSDIKKVFAFNVGIKVKFNGNLDLTSFSGTAYSYDVNKASIYGMAKYNNTWKGVRIDKSKN